MNLLFTYALARRLKDSDSGVTASAYFPGLTKSHLMDEMAALPKFMLNLISSKPEKSAGMLSLLAVDPMYQVLNGKFIKFNGKEIESAPYSHDNAIQEKLWETSERIVKSLKKPEPVAEPEMEFA